MVISIDFDGTVVEHRYPKIGEEIPHATETLRKLMEDGHKLVLWTSSTRQWNGAASAAWSSVPSTRHCVPILVSTITTPGR